MHTTNRSVAQGNIINIAPPKFGELVSISAGLLWTRLTIPSKLDHINIYLIKDKGGWFAIDSGPSSDANREIWEEIVQKLPLVDRPRLSTMSSSVMQKLMDHCGRHGLTIDLFG